MSWDQYKTWIAHEIIDPSGEKRDDLRAGTIAATIANGFSAILAGWSGEKDYKVLGAADFMPFLRKAETATDDTSEEPAADAQMKWKMYKEMHRAGATRIDRKA